MIKRYFFLTLFLGFRLAFGADLVLEGADGRFPFRVEVQGRSASQDLRSRHVFTNLGGSTVDLTLIFPNKQPVFFKGVALSAGMVNTYQVAMEDDEPRLTFVDNKPLASQNQPSPNSQAGGYSPYGRGNGGGYGNNGGYGRGDDDDDDEREGGYGHGSQDGYGHEDNRNGNGQRGYPGGYGYPNQPPYGQGRPGPGRPGGYANPAYQAELFRDLLDAVSYRNSDASKMAIIRQALPGLSPTSSQVLLLMDHLAFESTKKELAIKAFDVVVDPQNYFILAESFVYANSVNELAAYAMSRGPLYASNQAYYQTYDPSAFNKGLAAIQKQPFENTKLLLGRWVIQSMPLESRQVALLMDAYSFENSRLEIAKAAFSRVIDPERYFVVYRSFDFESSVRQLESYLAQPGCRR